MTVLINWTTQEPPALAVVRSVASVRGCLGYDLSVYYGRDLDLAVASAANNEASRTTAKHHACLQRGGHLRGPCWFRGWRVLPAERPQTLLLRPPGKVRAVEPNGRPRHREGRRVFHTRQDGLPGVP